MYRLALGFAAAVLAASVLGAQSAAAQSYLTPETPRKGLWVEAVHPDAKELEITAPSSAWFLSGRYPIRDRLWATAEIPVGYGKLDLAGAPNTGDNTVLGNPYLGIEYRTSERLMVELGARAPLTTADETSFGDVVGILADPLRGEAFMDDVVPLTAAVNVFHARAVGRDDLSLRARGGVTSVVWTGEEEDGETVTFLDYGVAGSYPVQRARLGAGISGRWDASADEGNFSDRSLHQLGLSADVRIRGVRPGVLVRIPLDETHRDLVSSSIGFYLQVPVR